MAMDPMDPRREAILVFNRITEHVEQPLPGNFDVKHLKDLHNYLFQDLAHLRPGETRDDTAGWSKHRAIEGRVGTHEVHYASSNVEGKAGAILRELGGVAGFAGMNEDQFANRMAKLYADLDHAHIFFEGNSRTLREFSRTLAQAAGYELNWAHTGTTPEDRNRLYLARDVAVLDRAFPGLTPERGMQTDSRAEYEASLALPGLRKAAAGGSLETIIREGTTALQGTVASPDKRYETAMSMETPSRVAGTVSQALGALYAAGKVQSSMRDQEDPIASRLSEMDRQHAQAAAPAVQTPAAEPGVVAPPRRSRETSGPGF